jgi:hypothetical protein
MITVDIRIEDDSALVLAAVRAVLAAEIEAAAIRIKQQAKATAPQRTGALRDSLEAVATPDPLTWYVQALALYALYVEMGTVKQAAQPYLLPAMLALQQGFIIAVENALS